MYTDKVMFIEVIRINSFILCYISGNLVLVLLNERHFLFWSKENCFDLCVSCGLH